MNTSKLKQEIQNAEKALARMKKELEEAEKMNNKDYYPKSVSVPFNVDKCIKVIDGDNKALLRSFLWFTPQGNKHWHEIYNGEIPLSNEDKITILRWCVNYYRSKNK